MGKFVDLTGQKYNKLTPLYRVENNKENKAQWMCKCDCGNLVVVVSRDLRNGNTKSCGCLNDEKRHSHVKDITGERFGRLVVVGRAGYSNSGKIIWECLCDCGNTTYVTKTNLTTKYSKTMSCGCYRRENTSVISAKDISNMVFGEVTAIKCVGSKSVGKLDTKVRIWECICSCGNHFFTSAQALLSGNTKSCGCVKSHNEIRIRKFLQKHNIKYEAQKTFIGCIDNALLKFDFYLPEYNIVIEYDGEFHYIEFEKLKTNLNAQKRRDEIKTRYCEENDIILLRIPYWEKDNIESILSEWLNIDCVEEANSSNASLSA